MMQANKHTITMLQLQWLVHNFAVYHNTVFFGIFLIGEDRWWAVIGIIDNLALLLGDTNAWNHDIRSVIANLLSDDIVALSEPVFEEARHWGVLVDVGQLREVF